METSCEKCSDEHQIHTRPGYSIDTGQVKIFLGYLNFRFWLSSLMWVRLVFCQYFFQARTRSEKETSDALRRTSVQSNTLFGSHTVVFDGLECSKRLHFRTRYHDLTVYFAVSWRSEAGFPSFRANSHSSRRDGMQIRSRVATECCLSKSLSGIDKNTKELGISFQNPVFSQFSSKSWSWFQSIGRPREALPRSFNALKLPRVVQSG